MNALPVWDDEPRLAAAPVPDPLIALTTTTPEPLDPFADLPADPRRLALARAIETMDHDAAAADTVLHLLAAIDEADADAGIARVDTTDSVLAQRIARIILGANGPSRGPVARAREVLALLRTHGAA